MMLKRIFVLVILTVGLTTLNAQRQKNFVKVTGTVTDIDNNPIKNATIFIDSVKTNVKTNKKGSYKIKINPQTNEVAVFVNGLGLLAKKYNGERLISFVFRTDKNAAFVEDMIIGMGYKVDIKKVSNSYNTGSNYSDFGSVYEILDKRFPFVKINNGTIKIGNGLNCFNCDSTPLILVDDMRVNVNALENIATTDIRLIKVIRRGSEAAAYGSLSATNGVILIYLKNGNDN